MTTPPAGSRPYPVPEDEVGRLAALAEYQMTDSEPEQDFDRLAQLAARLFEVPIVLISLMESERQLFKARINVDQCEVDRGTSFCAYTIMQDDILLVPDATADPRFADNPMVVGPPFVRFYVGKSLIAPSGHRIGTVCLVDHVPRASFTEVDRRNLTDLAALVMDRMELRRLEYARTVSQTRFENIAATSPDAIICSSSAGAITFWNRAAERVFGYSAGEIVGRSSEVIVPATWHRIYEAELTRLRQGERMELADQTVELSGLRKDGTEFPAEYSLSTWVEGEDTSVGAIVRDVTERKLNEERLFRLASLDALTDLPNRTAWNDRLAELVGAETPATVILLDLDEFKEINDTLGHSAGDAVLSEVASRLRQTCHDAAMIARLGGDEFVVLLPGDDERYARFLAERLTEALSATYVFAGEQLRTSVSIGVSFYPRYGATAEELLGSADLALYRAKAEGKGRYEFFAPALREAAVARRNFEAELRRGFEQGQFELFYQPQVATADERILGAEALIRWHHPERGLLTPDAFVEVLSQKPSAPEIGTWILETACRQAAVWREAMPGFRMGVNLFEAQVRRGNLLETVRRILAETGLPADGLELEIVENVLLPGDAATAALLTSLRELGVGLAFDDYGTGFASLSLLKRYPVSRLKIDRTFLRDVDTDPENAAVVRAVLQLAETFGMETIAEGVETRNQLDFLRANGCAACQGYLVGTPVTAEEFSRLLLPG